LAKAIIRVFKSATAVACPESNHLPEEQWLVSNFICLTLLQTGLTVQDCFFKRLLWSEINTAAECTECKFWSILNSLPVSNIFWRLLMPFPRNIIKMRAHDVLGSSEILIAWSSDNNYCGSQKPVQTNFWATSFLLLAQSNSNSPRSLERFRQTLRQNFNLIRQQMKNFPIDPHCKNRQSSATSSYVF